MKYIKPGTKVFVVHDRQRPVLTEAEVVEVVIDVDGVAYKIVEGKGSYPQESFKLVYESRVEATAKYEALIKDRLKEYEEDVLRNALEDEA